MGRFYYSFPVVSVMLGGFFYFTLDNFIIRLVIFTAWTCILTWAMAVVFFRSASAESNYLYLTAGGISTIYGLTILVHTVFWMQNPSYGFFYNAGFQSLHFTSVLIYEIWFGMLIMMMNNQRLGLVLHKSKTVLKHHISELEKASSEIKILKGLLPICATCKKIRDEQGTWNNLESYIDRHSEAQFSHGICPDCAVTARKEINDFCNSLER